MIGAAITVAVIGCVAACWSGMAWELARQHPTPSQTGLIGHFLAAGAIALGCIGLEIILGLVALVRWSLS